MPIPLLAIGAGIGLANSIGRFFSGVKQKKEAKKINPIWQGYQTNPYAKAQLGLAQNMFNGRMAGAGRMEQNIASNQASTVSNIGRLATDSSQALALATGAQGQSNNAYNNLALQESQNKNQMLGNLNQAYGGMVREGDKVYQSNLQKYQMDAQRKDALNSAGMQNKYGAVSDLSSMAFGLGGIQQQGGFDGMFSGFGSNVPQTFHSDKYAGVMGSPIPR